MGEKRRRQKIMALKLSELRKIMCKKRERKVLKRGLFQRRTYRKREKVEVREEERGQFSFGANSV